MSDLEGIAAIIAELRDELNRCPATKNGYREAASLRADIAMWKNQMAAVAGDHIGDER